MFEDKRFWQSKVYGEDISRVFVQKETMEDELWTFSDSILTPGCKIYALKEGTEKWIHM